MMMETATVKEIINNIQMKQLHLQLLTNTRFIKTFLVCFSLFFSLILKATDYTINAGTRYNWTDASTWVGAVPPPYSPLGVSGGNDQVYVTTTTVSSVILSQDLTLDNGVRLYIGENDTLIVKNLTINSSSNVYIAGVLIVIGNLTNAQQITSYGTAGTVVVTGDVVNAGNINGGVTVYCFGTWSGTTYSNSKTQTQFDTDYSSSTTMSKSVVGSGVSLPIELTSFKAKQNKDYVVISWVTETETNNDYFLLERSTDGETWEDVYSCKGAGTSSIAHNYSFCDYEQQSQIYYYRLKQTDFDGNSTFSKIITVNSQLKSTVRLLSTIFDGEHITISGLANGENTIKILSAIGELKYATSLQIDGSMTVNLDLDNRLPAGSYFVQITSNNHINTVKVLAK